MEMFSTPTKVLSASEVTATTISAVLLIRSNLDISFWHAFFFFFLIDDEKYPKGWKSPQVQTCINVCKLEGIGKKILAMVYEINYPCSLYINCITSHINCFAPNQVLHLFCWLVWFQALNLLKMDFQEQLIPCSNLIGNSFAEPKLFKKWAYIPKYQFMFK